MPLNNLLEIKKSCSIEFKKSVILQFCFINFDKYIAFQHPVFYMVFAIAVPILIHLFNFRRYRTVYFSNVKLLKDIQQKTKRESITT